MDKFQYRFTRFGFMSICIGSIALVCVISRCSTSFFDYALQKFEFSFPENELRRSVYTAGEENRVVDSRDIVSQQILSIRSSNSSVSDVSSSLSHSLSICNQIEDRFLSLSRERFSLIQNRFSKFLTISSNHR